MLRRRRKVQPLVDQYISRRYDDTAVVIYEDLRSGCRALPNRYAVWLEGHLVGFPVEQRERYSLLRTPAPSVSGERAAESGRERGTEGNNEQEEEGERGLTTIATASSRFCTIL